MGTKIERGKNNMKKQLYPYLTQLLKYVDFIELYEDTFMISDYNKLTNQVLELFEQITKSEIVSISFYNKVQSGFVIERILKRGEFKTYFGKLQIKKEDLNVKEKWFEIESQNEIFSKNIDFQNLKVKYIIPLRLNEVFGFITLSETDSFESIDQNSFKDFIRAAEILFASIANNRMMLEQIDLLEKKLMLDNTLFDVIYNIQMVQNIDDFYKTLENTLSIVYKMKKIFIMKIEEDNKFNVISENGINDNKISGHIKESIKEINDGIIYSFSGRKIEQFFDTKIIRRFQGNNCFIMASLEENSYSVGINKEIPKYVICILDIERGLKNEHIMLLENLFKVISTKHQELIEKEFKKNIGEKENTDGRDLFLSNLKEKIYDYENFNIEFYVHYKYIDLKPFEMVDIKEYKDNYIIGNYIFNIGFDPYYKEDFIFIERPKSIDEFLKNFK